MRKQKGASSTILVVMLVVIMLALFTGVGSYNGNVDRDEAVTASWSEVTNQYKRRDDLIPNIVSTVKGYAAHEASTLEAVINARAAATSMKVTPETLNNPEAIKKFQVVQGELSSALSRLMMVSEKYPDLKANEGFRDLRVQLEGTENRITVARNRYIKSVNEYNVGIRSFPANLFSGFGGFHVKPNFQVENEAAISDAPKIDFDKK